MQVSTASPIISTITSNRAPFRVKACFRLASSKVELENLDDEHFAITKIWISWVRENLVWKGNNFGKNIIFSCFRFSIILEILSKQFFFKLCLHPAISFSIINEKLSTIIINLKTKKNKLISNEIIVDTNRIDPKIA